ncbi:Gfo/Idh/MocA family oxidoreductase [Cryobacterium algoritolerans]|uniref:Gfo/Idh/MocA family oxidoreductase n=1 Tax=Cryobacterium algoritolerans TaxID=1259184 RepID=A0A4R8WWA5_9MICO|nr:Gfo/Idh/MocA family oxidoreductase [Cryobacterium algoritolerans]TFC19202.1 Gfo/Idh/MocA family oxidoreductase [Cryobacterium algoritolerans]
MTARTRVALVGAGSMGSHHARVIAQSDRADLTYLIDPREDVGRAVAARYDATWLPELPELTGIDAVVVAAATEAHYPLAMQVLSQNRPLLIEKPVADSLLRTREILDEAEIRNLPFMCGLLERFNPAVVTARTLLGSPIHITSTRHSPYAQRIKTGVAWDLLVHDVDLAILLMNTDPVHVDARLGFFNSSSEPGAEDVAETLLEFEGGGIAQISASRLGQRKIRQLSIYEDDRLIELDLLRRDITVYHHISENSADGEGRGYKQQTVIEIPELATSQEPLTAQFEHFLALVAGTADAAVERESILPPHRVIEEVISRRPDSHLATAAAH